MKIPITGTQRLNAVTITTPAFDWRTAALLLLSLLVGMGAGQAFAGYHEVTHVFSIDDIVGDFQGSTYGTAGNQQDTSIICSGAGCPTVSDKDGRILNGIDSEFGFYVTDFAGAIPKVRDNDYGEGFAANIEADGQVIGISVANVATDTFRTQSGRGTWCAGLGNTSVKCSAEQYVVMEHVKTCYETIPYMIGDPERANPVTGAQAVLDYDGTDVLCDDYQLDNTLITIGDVIDYEGEFGAVGAVLTPEGTTIASAQILYDGLDGWLLPNESTVLENIAASADYSVTGKDDGKPLYRWGDLHKRPNDIRMYARMALPPEWKLPGYMAANGGLGLRIESALLSVDHVVTNNPNDQLRPEDMENEGAIGRKPGYVDLSVGGIGLVSDRDCYEADADFIPSASVYQNLNYPYGGLVQPPDPYTWSSDLKSGWTNGYYTTVDREPFEWSYEDGDGNLVGSPVPNDALGTLVSGPRWRMTSQKFGQTVPGLEIPIIECSEPPYQKDNIKYDVGADYTTVINLLDWNPKDLRSVTVPALDPDGVPYPDAGMKVSPLAFSNGWVEEAANDGTVVNEDVAVVNGDLEAISINGAPISEDFDLSVYVKGDKKATKVFDATLMVTYQDYVPPTDVSAVSLVAPAQVSVNDTVTLTFTVDNPQAVPVDADIEICGDVAVEPCVTSPVTLAALGQSVFNLDLTAPAAAQTVNWTATVTDPLDTDLTNNEATASTEVVDVPVEVDLVAVSLVAPATIRRETAFTVSFTVNNPDEGAVDADIQIVGTGTSGFSDSFSASATLASGDNVFNWDLVAPWPLELISWTATVTAAVDPNPANDTQTASTKVTRW